MPPIRQILCGGGLIRFTDNSGIERILNGSDIPVALTTAQMVEDWINKVWIPTNVSGYQMNVHIISLIPFSVAVLTADLDTVIRPNWWQE